MSFTGPASAEFEASAPPLHSMLQTPRLSSSSAPPFYSINRLGKKTGRRILAASCIALFVHLAGAAHQLSSLHEVRAFALQIRTAIHNRRIQTVEVHIEVPVQPPPPPPPQAEPAPVAPERRVPRRRVAKRRAAPPPSAAQAARVMTAKADPDEPLDLTGNTFIQGTASSYAGGVSASNGTSKAAVRDRNARAKGVNGGRGTKRGASLSSRARPIKNQWNCPFPSEADLEQVNYMSVPVAVVVNPTGRARSAKATKKTGYGFGRAAERCAKKKRYLAARDQLGKAVTSTIVFTINFRR